MIVVALGVCVVGMRYWQWWHPNRWWRS